MTTARLKARSCSIECYKSHQNSHSDLSCLIKSPNGLLPNPKAAVMLPSTSNNCTDSGCSSLGTHSPSSLDSATDVQNLYARYPQLQDQLIEIYEATTEPLKNDVNNQSFGSESSNRRRGRGRVRGLADDGKPPATRSRYYGVKSGIHRLRTLRDFEGEAGHGLRVFSKIIAGSLEAGKSTIIASPAR